MSREVKLTSGALLKVNTSPFVDAKNLWQALLRELKIVKFDAQVELAPLFRDLFFTGFSSPEIEAYLFKCMERCTYRGAKVGDQDMKIDMDTFEPAERREDFTQVCMEVAKENVLPFGKSLFAEFKQLLATMGVTP